MADVSQILWSLVTSAVGSGLAAAVALQRYLDNQKRQDCRIRYLDNGCDELARLMTHALSTEARRMRIAAMFIRDIGNDSVADSARSAYLKELNIDRGKIEGLSIPRTLRLAAADSDLTMLIAVMTRIVWQSEMIGGPIFLSLAALLETLAPPERVAKAVSLDKILSALALDLEVLSLSVPTIFETIGSAFTHALSADYEFDFDIAVSRTRAAVDGHRPAILRALEKARLAGDRTRAGFRAVGANVPQDSPS
jgi:hypothetical protein